MSNLPSRTRSLRKPAGEAGRWNEKSALAESAVANAAPQPAARTSQSPSRLPVKPSTRSATISSRPPSATESVNNATSMRRPSAQANTGKQTTGGLHRSSSTRNPNVAPNIEPVKQDRSRPPLTQSRHLRNVSTTSTTTTSSVSAATRGPNHTRSKSSTVLNASTTLRPPTRESAHVQTSGLVQADSQPKRPAFSTLQQHFSPAKNLAPKPHPAAFLAPPSPSKLPSNIAISAETAKLQNELLQLHILHRDVAQVNREWSASAKKKLGARFQSVVDRNAELVALEVEETGKINASALQQWQDTGTPGWGLEEKVQVLDEVVTGVWNLGESGGKYAKVVRKFERWLSRCQDILQARSREYELGDEDVAFLGELDSSWKDDCLNLDRKLVTWRDHLKHLGSPDPGSSLASVVEGCRILIQGMLEELAIMGQIEKDAMSMELEWIKRMNDDTMHDEEMPVAGAVWRQH